MSWSNPNEHGIVIADGIAIAGINQEVLLPCASEYHRRCRRLNVDGAAMKRAYSPFMRWDTAMGLAADRDRLLDDFRD